MWRIICRVYLSRGEAEKEAAKLSRLFPEESARAMPDKGHYIVELCSCRSNGAAVRRYNEYKSKGLNVFIQEYL